MKSVRLSDAAHRALKLRAAERGVTLAALLEAWALEPGFAVPTPVAPRAVEDVSAARAAVGAYEASARAVAERALAEIPVSLATPSAYLKNRAQPAPAPMPSAPAVPMAAIAATYCPVCCATPPEGTDRESVGLWHRRNCRRHTYNQPPPEPEVF